MVGDYTLWIGSCKGCDLSCPQIDAFDGCYHWNDGRHVWMEAEEEIGHFNRLVPGRFLMQGPTRELH
jgi:hypothetical protein